MKIRSYFFILVIILSISSSNAIIAQENSDIVEIVDFPNSGYNIKFQAGLYNLTNKFLFNLTQGIPSTPITIVSIVIGDYNTTTGEMIVIKRNEREFIFTEVGQAFYFDYNNLTFNESLYNQ